MRFSVALLTAAFVQAQPAKLPSFEEFNVSQIFRGKPAQPRLRTAFARQFATAIREGAEKGPNFAGSLALVQWGCGSSCIQMAVIDEQTGTVYQAPFDVLDFGSMHVFSDGTKNFDTDTFEPLAFHVNSRLLIVRGCPEENQNNCATFYYEWSSPKFRLLQRFTAIPPAADPRAR